MNFSTEIKNSLPSKERAFPHILAPAGDKDSFLAALAAGADGIFCGLKLFSARMEAENFGTKELADLTKLASSKGTKVYVTFNSMVKEDELEKIARLFRKLAVYVQPHALIIQDPGLVMIAREAGFSGELHLSTLGNASCSLGFEGIRQQGIDQVVLPRELTVDEIKKVAKNTPQGLGLEVFIHGALCYAVSGRCYWSSWFGGKSGLRGRCVQPCRRVYRLGKEQKRFFSCMDLGIDVLVKVLKQIPQVTAWKIEGRKKSPHYVFYTVKAYKMLRDEGNDPKKRKIALAFLEYAMGRKTNHYNFLTHRKINPLDHNGETGSGMLIGRIRHGHPNEPGHFFVSREPLFAGDLLRFGYEDSKGHAIRRVTRPIPKKGKFTLPKGSKMLKDAPVFLIDRKEPAIAALIKDLDRELSAVDSHKVRPVDPQGKLSCSPKSRNLKSKNKKPNNKIQISSMILSRGIPGKKTREEKGVWIQPGLLPKLSKKNIAETWWWLPPVVWPEKEDELYSSIQEICKRGARKFVLNTVWHISMMADKKMMDIWAGPFCNITNTATIAEIESMGFKGAVVSPELGREDFLSLPSNSSLPLGVVVKGNWPLCISRIIAPGMKQDTLFTSPRKEGAWISKRWDSYWTFPQWELDITSRQKEFQMAGYKKFIIINEPIPSNIDIKQRPGLWNWKTSVL